MLESRSDCRPKCVLSGTQGPVAARHQCCSAATRQTLVLSTEVVGRCPPVATTAIEETLETGVEALSSALSGAGAITVVTDVKATCTRTQETADADDVPKEMPVC